MIVSFVCALFPQILKSEIVNNNFADGSPDPAALSGLFKSILERHDAAHLSNILLSNSQNLESRPPLLNAVSSSLADGNTPDLDFTMTENSGTLTTLENYKVETSRRFEKAVLTAEGEEGDAQVNSLL